MIYVFLADGFEDMEAIVPIDVLRRTGLEVQTVGVSGEYIKSCGKIELKTDISISNIRTENIEAMILPGGMTGVTNLDSNYKVHEFVNYCVEKNILIGAICAAPTILGNLGALENKEACCFPGFERKLKGAILSNKPVCVFENIITAKGPGVALEFALELVKYLKGETFKNRIKSYIQCQI
ncbi:MAG: DJ-1/PfpI family protein [Candidatus Paraimprobicoccus trichonymphae]|uniref:DJ-1/PfpI family protein n=1 Tax=Candidatus Paraimprobicoccus trichonymphae TaxID=3033793 RepID=A0AA48I5E8_9FIRM|nr:MAG: DJ-1/PfpI family protein [Candidatus Paraimprobicoccus trichonymphae]